LAAPFLGVVVFWSCLSHVFVWWVWLVFSWFMPLVWGVCWGLLFVSVNGFCWLLLCVVVGGFVFAESLILAQDERWRRA